MNQPDKIDKVVAKIVEGMTCSFNGGINTKEDMKNHILEINSSCEDFDLFHYFFDVCFNVASANSDLFNKKFEYRISETIKRTGISKEEAMKNLSDTNKNDEVFMNFVNKAFNNEDRN